MTKTAGCVLALCAGLFAGRGPASAQEPRRFNFENDIVPLLSKFGCNSSGCHGKAEGQNGFKLSVFGFDPSADYTSLTQEGRGRRVLPSLPERSLLLAKASGGVPHGGGVRIFRGTDEYRTLHDWISAGLPFGAPDDPCVVAIEVTPRERELTFAAKQPLRVTATWSDGRRSDVTRHARFQSNAEGLAAVDEGGLVTAGETPGDVAVMASYLGQVDVFRALIPRPERIESYPSLPAANFIDGLVYAKLKKLHELPSPPASDADFLRRVFLDIIGTLPTAAEARAFLADEQPDRRGRLVERLLARPEFADFWALKWSDVLRVDRQVLGHKRAYAYYRWIRDSLAANVPYDKFCREIVAAEGPLADAPAAAFYKVVAKPGEMGGTLSQAFLGVRIDCAQCHHHPFDRWSQDDYYGMQAFFTQVSFKPAAGGESLVAGNSAATVHPRTGAPVFAHALAAAAPSAEPEGDRRKLLAAWMTSRDNPWFARNFVNRVWAHFLGRGIVEPVDDVRLTNPPTNPELLDALARHFADSGFDFRQLIRTITASRVYQASATPNATNERDDRNYARALLRSVSAEVLLDAVCQTTGVPEKFQGMPAGCRAIQLWDSQTPHYFLKLFGRPTRTTACECERTSEPSVAQVLHILNSTELHGKLSHAGGQIARLTATIPDDAALAEELYLTFYSRYPTESERQTTMNYLAARQDNRRQAAEDIAWSMLNTSEFVFNH
ncbi:MAG: DUF1549 domain-containing protein [Planctomycetia bacterium]|nr:DUF1549 domain-containing protein [Planctomycetia bacterium]